MKPFIAILLILGAVWGLQQLIKEYKAVEARQELEERQARGEQIPQEPQGPQVLPGLPAHLEASLEEAKGHGAASLLIWLNKHRPQIQDPRLAEIELDYVVLAPTRDYQEVKKLFQAIKARTPENSPLYSRIKQLERNYQ